MGYIERIQKTIDYIENNIGEDITLDKLAEVASFSKFYYHRIFHAMIGYPVKEYIR